MATRIWQRLQDIDRRVLYALIAVSVIIPVFLPLSLPTAVTVETQAFYDALDAIPDGGTVMMAFDVWPSTLAETEPMLVAVLTHLRSKNCKVVGLSNVGMGGPSIAERLLRTRYGEAGLTYGVDYVNLGYKANYQAVLLGMGESIKRIFPTDFHGTLYEEIPILQSITNYDQLDYIVIISDNAVGEYWPTLVRARYDRAMALGVTAVMAPKLLSFFETGQIDGLLGGMKGAAEYEGLLDAKGDATRGMDSQSLIHLVIIGFVILGNIGHFASRRAKREATA